MFARIKRKTKYPALLLSLCLLLVLSGCRVRTGLEPEPEAEEVQTAALEHQETVTPDIPEELPEEPPVEEPPEPQAPSEDQPLESDPQSDRRQFDETAPAQDAEDAEQAVSLPSEEPIPEGDAPIEGAGEEGETPVTQVLPAEEAPEMGASEDAPVADSSLVYYQTLLADRLGDLFECKRLNVYCELPQDYVAALKGSREYELIGVAGSYCVSVKLTADAAQVDDGWILRKNPDAVVKFVGGDVLGSGMASSAAAASLRESLSLREGWNQMQAVKDGKVILASEDLLASEALRTACAVYLACAFYPDTFADTDPAEALQQLSAEYYGSAMGGTFVLMP